MFTEGMEEEDIKGWKIVKKWQSRVDERGRKVERVTGRDNRRKNTGSIHHHWLTLSSYESL